jgi:uncharacterized protein
MKHQAFTASPTTHLLYLHGFRSSPQSFKAQAMQAWLSQHRPDVLWRCPQLPPSPAEAMALIHHTVQRWPATGAAVVGSSLGGFYATAWAEQNDWPCVVLNPAVEPARDLAAHIGEQSAFHSPAEKFFFRAEYVDELRVLHVPRISRPERYLAVIAKGDELLDWQEMQARYAGAAMRLIDGSDHALSDFDQHLPAVLRFLRLLD